MPISPAWPNHSAHADQAKAVSVPSETSVSIVRPPWRRFTAAARWNGQPPHSTTGVASTSDTHCHPGNCSAGAIASTITGTVSTVETMSRRRSGSRRGAGSVRWAGTTSGSGAGA